MGPEVCADSFLMNFSGNIICTFAFKDRSTLQAGDKSGVAFRVIEYTTGTHVDPTHAKFGFHVIYSPAPGDAAFPAGVVLSSVFVNSQTDQTPAMPDMSGGPNEVKQVTLKITYTIDNTKFVAVNEDVKIDAGFNPGV